MRLGQNIKMRRKKLKLSQQQLAEDDWTRSYISQIESERIQPPVETLAKIAAKLDTTVSELIGDDLLLRKAKATIFHPNICQHYLAQLPKTPTTIFLYELTNSLLTNKSLECQIPPNAELYYLTARVYISQKNYHQAHNVLIDGLRFLDQFWRILFLNQLCFVEKQLNHTHEYQVHKQQLLDLMTNIDSVYELHSKLVHELQYEQDPVRANNIIMFIQTLDYSRDLHETIQLLNE